MGPLYKVCGCGLVGFGLVVLNYIWLAANGEIICQNGDCRPNRKMCLTHSFKRHKAHLRCKSLL